MILISLALGLYHAWVVRCGVSATPYMDVREDYAHHEFINMVVIPPEGPAVVSGHDANLGAAEEGLYPPLFLYQIIYIFFVFSKTNYSALFSYLNGNLN